MKFSGLLLAFLIVVSMTVSTNAVDKGFKKILGVLEGKTDTPNGPVTVTAKPQNK